MPMQIPWPVFLIYCVITQNEWSYSDDGGRDVADEASFSLELFVSLSFGFLFLNNIWIIPTL